MLEVEGGASDRRRWAGGPVKFGGLGDSMSWVGMVYWEGGRGMGKGVVCLCVYMFVGW